MANILHLPDWNVLNVKETEDGRWIEAAPIYTPDHCPACGVVPNFYGHGTKRQSFRDLPSLGKASIIVLDRKRYRCRDCGATFLLPLREMDEKRQMTQRLAEWIRRESIRRTFADVAREVGLDEKTVRNLFHEYVEELGRNYSPLAPRRLGIDEIHLIRRPRAIITNLEAATVVDMLKDREKATLEAYFAKWGQQNCDIVEVVAMDMWKQYREVSRTVFRHATIVVDKFHVVKTANICMDLIRKQVKAEIPLADRRSLRRDRFILLRRPKDLTMKDILFKDMWLASFPQLGEAYRLKEEFFGIYDAKTRAEAAALLDAWRDSVPPGKVKAAYKSLLTLTTNWREEILNYFDHRYTNAPTEALNRLVREAHAAGRGYSFDAIRAKMLFRESVRKRRKPPRMPPGDAQVSGCMDSWTARAYHVDRNGQPYFDEGADISTLVDLLTKGEL